MSMPKRGEIWRVKWRGKMGTELGTGKLHPHNERPCLVVSGNYAYLDANGERFGNRLTVVPLSEWLPRKEQMRSLWVVTITNRIDIEPDPWHSGYPHLEQLKEWETKTIPYKSIIDCGQIWTIPAIPNDLRSELRFDRRYGKLNDEKMEVVDGALQIVIGGNIQYRQIEELKVREGKVLDINLPQRNRSAPQRCLVVSSVGIDAVREHLKVEINMGEEKRELGQCTVVPLVSEEEYTGELGAEIVDVYSEIDQVEDETMVAICMEMYTVDWRSRGGEVVGHVSEKDLKDVRKSLRDYLYLPRIST